MLRISLLSKIIRNSGVVCRYVRMCENPGGGYIQGHNLSEPVFVTPGSTVTVTLGGAGRPVKGKFSSERFKDKNVAVDWNFAHGTVRPYFPQQTENVHRALSFLSADQNIIKNYICAVTGYEYAFQVKSDGSFWLDDFAPGMYEMDIYVNGPPVDVCGPGASLGHLNHKFVVPFMAPPQSDEPLDLGVLYAEPMPASTCGKPDPNRGKMWAEKERKQKEMVNQPAPEFELPDFDGGKLSLKDPRGGMIQAEIEKALTVGK